MSWTQERARVAALTRSRTADDPDLIGARRNLAAERLAEHIARVVAEAPPLTEAQRSSLALLLHGSSKSVGPPGLTATTPTSGGTTSAATPGRTTNAGSAESRRGHALDTAGGASPPGLATTSSARCTTTAVTPETLIGASREVGDQ